MVSSFSLLHFIWFLNHHHFDDNRHHHPTPVLWPIKSVQRNSSPKAQWTERYIYYLGKFCPGTFFSNGRISGTKRDFVNALAPKFSSCPGLSPTLSWKWPPPTLSSSFGLFLEREPFFGVFQVGHFGPFGPKHAPGSFFIGEKKSYRGRPC